MAFENIDVGKLRTALYSCRDSLNHSTTDELIGTLSGNQWIADSKNNLRGSLEKLVNVRYKNLKSQINHYLNVTTLIEQYKNLQNQNISLNQQIKNLEPSLVVGWYVPTTTIGSNGKIVTTQTWVTGINYVVQNQINNLKYQIALNNQQMEILKANVDNSI